MAPTPKNPQAEANRRVADRDRRASVLAFLKKRVWNGVRKEELGRVLTHAEEDAILGFGPQGV